MRVRAIASATAVTIGMMSVAGIVAPAARADTGTITVNYSNGTNWPAAPTGPTNMYNNTQPVYARSSTGQVVSFSASGGCTVKYTGQSGNGASQATITGTNGATDCILLMTSPSGNGLDASSVTYTLASIPTGQTVKFGNVMSKSTVTVNKTYVLGTYPLKTKQGKTVTFAIDTGSKYCSVKKDKSKGWLLKVGSRSGKCSVKATAAAISPNYSALNRKQYWSAVK